MTDEYTLDGEQVERAAGDVTAQPEGRRVDLRLVAWGDVATDPTGYRETIMRGAFADADPAGVVLESGADLRNGGHETRVVGVAEAIVERDDGAYATFRVSPTPAGDELLALIKDRALNAASVVFKPVKSKQRADGVIERHSLSLRRVAVLARGGYQSARVLAVRSEAADAQEAEPVNDLAPVVERIDNIDATIARMEAQWATPSAPAADPFAQYADIGEYAKAVYRGDVSPEVARTFADQITSQNDGLNPVGWITDIKRIVFLGRRAINAFGGPGPLPASGMSIKYPFLSSSNTLVGVQSTQKTEITSARIDIDDGDGTISTYAGGSDISLQLLERGTPSYLTAYQRIMTNYWANVTDDAFVTALEAGSQTQTMGNALGANIAMANPSAASDDILDTTGAHGLSIGDAVVFTSLTGGTGLTAGRVYWVVATSFGSTTFRVATTPGGTAVGFSTDITAGNVNKVNTTASGIRASLFTGSVQVESATGSPASIALASTDVFLALAGLTDIVPNYPTNVTASSGIQNGGDLRINVNGLDIVHKSTVSAGKIILSNPMAAQWLEDGPRFLDATNAQKLGRDVSIYSFGVGMVYVPAGVVEMTFV
jgi:HK97 family phage prohead protease